MGSVETVTVLITDLVGSTGLESRVGPAVADQLRGEHFGLIREALAESGGREVKNTGDGLMLVFDSAATAVECAAGIQQRFEFRNRSAAEQLVVKVGLSAGDATAEGRDYFGMPVIEAARLCDRCAGGQILAKELVAHLAAGRGQKFSSVGGLELKGLPEPLSVVEVVWERRAKDQRLLPLPPRLQEAPPVGLVGRVGEGERLRKLIADVASGERRLALLSGEPGIGKTRLSTHAALQARSETGAAVLFGRCEEELPVPYGPWVEALSHFVEHAPDELLRAHGQRHGGELGRLVPGLRARVPSISPARSSDPDTERYLLWGAVVGLLRAASQREPLVLILDDLHWADKPSLLLLKHVLVEGQGVRALLIGTYRDSELHHGHPLAEVLANLHRFEGVERLALTGLAQPEIVELMERASGHKLDRAGMSLAGQLHRETDGNPFYMGELLRHLLDSGVIYQQENGRFTVRGDTSSLGLPQSVREVLGRRIARLGEEEPKVLSVAAVIGREFDLELLLAVTDRDEDELLELLERAVAASVLNESSSVLGRFYFAHALINHTLYEDLGPTRRARLHRRIAEALEEQLAGDPGARVGELAHHWAKATAVDLDKAMTYARMAGDRALDELAPDEALQWFARALELLGDREDPATRCDLLIGLGEAQRLAGAAEYRQTLLEASRLASEQQDGERAARAALANTRGRMPSAIGQVDQERVAAIERALELDDLADTGRRAMLLALQAIELLYEHDHRHRRALAEQALALAREVGSPRTTARVLTDYLYVFWAPDGLERRCAHLDELSAAVHAAADPGIEFWAAAVELHAMVEAGELERAEKAADRMSAIAERLREPTMRWAAAFCAGCVALLRGDLAEVEHSGKQALHIGRDAGQPDAFMVYASQIGFVRLMQGRVSDVSVLEQNVRANPRLTTWRATLAWVLCWLGRRGEAAAIVAEAAADGFEHVPWELNRTGALALYADAAAQAGVTDAVEILYELIEPWADQVVWNGAVTYGHARTYLALLAAALGWDKRADEHFARACEIQEQQRMLMWAARAHLGWAEALAARGEAERARPQAALALELSREQGYGLFEPRAAAILEVRSPVG